MSLASLLGSPRKAAVPILPRPEKCPAREVYEYTERVPAESRHKDQRVAHYLDLFEPLGSVTARSIFGEYGFFCQGVMFALIWQGTLFVRVSDHTRARHEARALKPFVYVSREGKSTQMPYYELPPEAFDSPGDMQSWASPALDAALANAREKQQRKRRKVTRQGKKARSSGNSRTKKRIKAPSSVAARRAAGATMRARRSKKPIGKKRSGAG